MSSVCTAGLGDSVEVNCVHLQIQAYFKGFSSPLFVKMGLLGISVLCPSGMGGWQQVKLPEEFIGGAQAIGTLGTQNRGPTINGVSEAFQ